jgi:Zn-dependent peptidase ImmA (M78 family)
MYYNIYTNIRNGAWQCLIDNNICSLPVDVMKIARQCGFYVKKNSDVNELLDGEDAKTLYNGKDWFIIYNDMNDTVDSRFAIAHELGHIFLGHEKSVGKYVCIEEFGKMPKSEQQADLFALRLLCPACVLMNLELCSKKEICDACRIPMHWAEKRSVRMSKLYKKRRFFSDPLEIKVNENFLEFYKRNNINLTFDKE